MYLSDTNKNIMETTREAAKQLQHEETVKTLQSLLQKNIDASEGYKIVMTKSEDKALTTFLQERAALRSAFVTELTDTLLTLNEKPAESGTLLGDVHHAWINVKSGFTNNSAESLLEECLRGEQSSIEEYDKALENEIIYDPTIEEIIRSQKLRVESTILKVKVLEDLY